MWNRTCTLPNCEKPHEARGFCPMHYRRWKLYGDPSGTAPRLLPTECTVDGCSQTYYGSGLCEMHYARRRRHGGLHDERAAVSDPIARFWSKVNKTGTCWLWTDGVNGSGYGSFKVDGRQIGAHVFALDAVGRAIPDGYEVDHLCFVTTCVRPDHLDVVTHAENLRRARERARTA